MISRTRDAGFSTRLSRRALRLHWNGILSAGFGTGTGTGFGTGIGICIYCIGSNGGIMHMFTLFITLVTPGSNAASCLKKHSRIHSLLHCCAIPAHPNHRCT